MGKQKIRKELEESKSGWETIAIVFMISFVIMSLLMLYSVDKSEGFENQLSECQIEHLHNKLDFFDWGFCSGYDGGERICYHQWQGDWIKCNQGDCEVIE